MKNIFIILSTALLMGCLNAKQTDGSVVITFKIYIPILFGLFSILAIWLGWTGMRRNSKKTLKTIQMFFCFIAGVLGLALATPGIATDKLTLSQSGLFGSKGFWFARKPYSIEFEKTARIEFVKDPKKDDKWKDFRYELKDGSKGNLPVGTLLGYAIPSVAILAQVQGVETNYKSAETVKISKDSDQN